MEYIGIIFSGIADIMKIGVVTVFGIISFCINSVVFLIPGLSIVYTTF
jgi:hypothetical protein